MNLLDFGKSLGKQMNANITIVGCGVIGLSTGIRLLEVGFAVRIVTDRLPQDTVSAIASAAWFPYHVGPHEKVLRWSTETRLALLDIHQSDPSAGVYPIELRELYDEITPDIWWATTVDDATRITAEELPAGFVDGVKATVPMAESPLYLPWLVRRFECLGGAIEVLIRPISDLTTIDSEIIINCTGLGAHKLCNDDQLYPIRGLVARATNPGITQMTLTEVDGLPTYVIPRRHDVILGGTTDVDAWDESIDHERLDAIVARCRVLVPELNNAEILEYQVGLRPGRKQVRLERERFDRKTIIHNYGHGGAGYGLSWGCADEVVALAQAIMQ